MSATNRSTDQATYYDPGEVETYVREATTTIRTLQARLQEAARRAEQAEQALGEYHPETASLGRALLLAGEVADKTLAEADSRAAEIIRAAEEQATAIVEKAEAEAQGLLDAAQDAAADVFQKGEARLLAAVRAFVDGSNVLREELAQVSEAATSWRGPDQNAPLTGAPPIPLRPFVTLARDGAATVGAPPRTSGDGVDLVGRDPNSGPDRHQDLDPTGPAPVGPAVNGPAVKVSPFIPPSGLSLGSVGCRGGDRA